MVFVDVPKLILLLSGGLDSVTAGAMLREAGYELYALSFMYGQRHHAELQAAKEAAEFLKVRDHKIIEIDLRNFGGSALTADIEVPKDHLVADEIPITYVPARNTIFLSYGLAYAEVIGANDIGIGVNVVDYSGYPDCRPEFISAFEAMANLSTKAAVEGNLLKIHTPLIHLTKREIIEEGLRLGVDYGKTHSCYDPSPTGKACGHCDSCLIRKRAFEELGMSDPVLGAS
ncbi:MAG: 7-cyano-7-deazaguanine synthase QueC [Armatimonadetes bacterium]|nr:7-cyano-7-deazaguanine synthase QueC [Armatimonadota bacterium]